MGAEERSWDPVSAMEEATAGASNGNAPGVPTVPSCPLSIDISLPLPEMKPHIMLVFAPLPLRLSSPVKV